MANIYLIAILQGVIQNFCNDFNQVCLSVDGGRRMDQGVLCAVCCVPVTVMMRGVVRGTIDPVLSFKLDCRPKSIPEVNGSMDNLT